MSDPMENGTEGDSPDVRAAEYVLGLLEPAERAEVAREIALDAALAARVQFWETHFATLNAAYGEVEVPADLIEKIEARLFPAPPKARWYDSLVVWRAATGLALAAALFGIGLNVLAPVPTEPDPVTPVPADQLVAALETLEGEIGVIARFDPATSSLRLTVSGPTAAAGSDYQLWLIEGESDPVSLGLIAPGQAIDQPITPELAALMGEGVALAVSLEPEGGSPEPVPTGPVIALGTATSV